MDQQTNFRGTSYAIAHGDSPTDPIRKGVIIVEGVQLQIAVYPERTSLSGNVYHPIRIRYAPNERMRLCAFDPSADN